MEAAKSEQGGGEQVESSRPASLRALVFIYATLFLDMMGASLLMPIVPYIIRQYNSDPLSVGLLSMVYSAAAFLSAPVLGRLSDQYGRRPVLLASVLGSALGYMLFGLGGALWVLFTARVIDGLTAGNIATAMAYLADSSRPQERAKMFAFAGVAFGVGFTLGPVIAGALSQINLAAPAYAAGGLSLLAFIFGLVFLPESLPAERRITGPLRLEEINPLAVIARMSRLPNLGLLLSAGFVLYLAYAGLFTYTSVFTMSQFDATAAQTASVFALVGLVQMVGQGGIVYRLTPRFGEKKVALVGLWLQALVYPLFLVVPSLGWLYPLAVLSALGNAFTRPTLDALVANSVEAREQGRAAGSTSAIYSLTSAIGPLMAGLAYQWMSPGAVFLAGGGLIAIAAILVGHVRSSVK